MAHHQPFTLNDNPSFRFRGSFVDNYLERISVFTAAIAILPPLLGNGH